MLARTLAFVAVIGSLAHPAHAARDGGRIGGQDAVGATTAGNAQDAFYNKGGNSTPDKGSFTYSEGRSIKYSADIDCVTVDGPRTLFSGVIRTATRTARYLFGIEPGITYLIGMIIDNAEPEEDRVGVSLINPDYQDGDAAFFCEQFFEFNNEELANGNAQVNGQSWDWDQGG